MMTQTSNTEKYNPTSNQNYKYPIMFYKTLVE